MGTWQFLSVNALDDPTKTIVMEDELESFFHVLLYMAICLLHHNFSDCHVPQFLRKYFDGYIPLITRNGCGPVKREAMRTGKFSWWINKDNKNDVPRRRALKFISPPTGNASTEGQNRKDESDPSSLQPASQPNQSLDHDDPSPQSAGDREPSATPSSTAPLPDCSHPLNGIFATLLSWFKAYHTLQESDCDEPAVKCDVQPQGMTEDPLHLNELDDSDSDSDTELDLPASARSRAPAVEPSRAALEEIAQNLRSHRPILQLFKDAVNNASWPVADCYPDRKPDKNWKPAGDLVPKKSTLAMSTKRPASAVDDLEPPSTPPKRSRA